MNWMERLNERAELMGRMLDTIGAMKSIPVSVEANLIMNTAAARCMDCRKTEACVKWLDEHPNGADKPLPECPNAALFNSFMKN